MTRSPWLGCMRLCVRVRIPFMHASACKCICEDASTCTHTQAFTHMHAGIAYAGNQ